MSLSSRLEPGARVLIQGLADDDNITEMMALWPVSGGDWIMLLPTGETVLVNVDAVAYGEIFTSEYPA